jgi:hypothetical protein
MKNAARILAVSLLVLLLLILSNCMADGRADGSPIDIIAAALTPALRTPIAALAWCGSLSTGICLAALNQSVGFDRAGTDPRIIGTR